MRWRTRITRSSMQLVAVMLGWATGGAAAAPARAADALPAELQAALTFRALAEDRALEARGGGPVVIGLLFRSGQAAGENLELVEAFSRLQSQTLRGHPVKVGFRAYQGLEDFEQWVERTQARVIYLSPRVPELAGLQRVCLKRKIITVSSSLEVVQGGTPVGFVLEGGKPKLLINLEAAKAVGMDPAPELLELAQLVK